MDEDKLNDPIDSVLALARKARIQVGNYVNSPLDSDMPKSLRDTISQLSQAIYEIKVSDD